MHEKNKRDEKLKKLEDHFKRFVYFTKYSTTSIQYGFFTELTLIMTRKSPRVTG